MIDHPLSFVESYARSYPENVVATRLGGSAPIIMHRLLQPAGVYEVFSGDSLSISLARNGGFEANIDAGAGRFYERWRAGSFIVMAPEQRRSLFDIHADIEVLNFSVPLSRVKPLVDEFADGLSTGAFESLHRRGTSDLFATQLLEELWGELVNKTPRGTLFVDHALSLLVCKLLALAQRPAKFASGGLAPWQIKLVCDAMMASLDNEEVQPGLPMLARLIDLSPNHFCNAFHTSLGMPPHRWLTHARMTRAQALLADQSLSLTDIALRVGFGSHTAFGTAFKRATGLTPSGFRRRI